MSSLERVERTVETTSLTSAWIETLHLLEGDVCGLSEAKTLMDHSTAIVHGQTVACSGVPRLFDASARSRMQYACETMHAILQKIIACYCSDPAFRALFPFSARAEKLIIDSWHERTSLPFARYDIFLDENTGDFTFCELNADGSSGMNEDREIARAMRATNAFAQFSQLHRLEENELVDSWIDTFIDLAGLETADTALVAICDYLETATLSEFEVYRKRFEERGLCCEICDIRSLVAKDGVLRTPNGRRIGAVWRRCVASDLLAHWSESQALIEAMRTGATGVFGDFSGIIAHDKRVFRLMHLPQTQEFLSEHERAFIEKHVPYTADLDSKHIDSARLKEEKNRWVIKPADGYGAENVYLGVDCDDERWGALVDAHIDAASGRPFIAQRFHEPFRSLAAPLDECAEGTAAYRPYANLSGLYAYNGRFAGTFSRLGRENIVSGLFGGLSAATFWTDCSRPDPRPQRRNRAQE